jgi:hypothetical protein
MKAKQLEVIKAKHAKFLEHGKTNRPDCETQDIQYALLNGTPPKLKRTTDIVSIMKRRLIEDRYDLGPKYSDIFEVPKNGRVAEWEAAEDKRIKRVRAYQSEVDPLLIDAELHDEADADEVMQAIILSAKKHGLYS